MLICRCEKCIYWRRNRPGWHEGECRRYPPWVVGLGGQHQSVANHRHWPATNADDWCGKGTQADELCTFDKEDLERKGFLK